MKKLVLITGASTGIGRGIAISFASNGYDVAINYISEEEEAKKLQQDYNIQPFKWDVTDFEACKQKIAEVEKHFGKNVDILINNAGITRDGMLHKQSYENWMSVINVNLNSVFNVTRSVIEKMRDAGFGRIINISSVNAYGCAGQTNYSATKAGIEGFTKALAIESASKGITVNAIAPGYTATKMVTSMKQEIIDAIVQKIPTGRLAQVDEISATALFLASDMAAFITGAVIPVNGGMHM